MLSEVSGAIKAGVPISRPLTHRVRSIGHDLFLSGDEKWKLFFKEVNCRTLKRGLSEAALAKRSSSGMLLILQLEPQKLPCWSGLPMSQK